MKKFLSKIMFATVAILSAAGFTSCNNADDDPYVPTPTSVQQQAQVTSEARYIANISEDAFKYANFTLTLEYNGEKQTFQFDESKKRDNVYFELMDAVNKPYMAARVLDIPFQYNPSRPVKATLNYELTEAGKQLIANAEKGEEIDFAISTALGKCTKTGTLSFNTKTDQRAHLGVYVDEFNDFLYVLMGDPSSPFFKKL